MKFVLRFSIILLILLEIFAVSLAHEKVCKYRRRQMTVGQTVTDCYTIATCQTGGILERRQSCPSYSCARKKRGFKPFNHRKPYPECCGGPICDERDKSYYYRPDIPR